MGFIKEKIKITCDNLFSATNKLVFQIEDIEYVKSSNYKTDNSFPKDGWEPFASGTALTGNDAHFWFRCKFHTPPAKENISYYLKVDDGMPQAWTAITPQGIIYLNGEMIQGVDGNHKEVILEPDTDYELHNYYYLGLQNYRIIPSIKLFELNQLTEQLYYDMKVAYDCAVMLNENSQEYNDIMPLLEQTANLIDFRDMESTEFLDSVVNAINFIGNEFYAKRCTVDGKPVVHCVGHTHIDVEWLWDRAQTREKVQRSFSTAINLMKRYPEYKFMLSQPELYRYLKEEAPEKYEELKELVKDGRWEPEGAMWVEADCNLISGESFVRQIMQGKKFFKDEFGIDSQILFLPDVFGYSAAMPQILKKAGIRHFVTSKISWNETNTLPVDRFVWEGIDGSEIFTNFITTQNYTGVEPNRIATYVGLLTPSHIKGTYNRFKQKEYGKDTMTTFGHGDGGGGPTKEMLETQRRLSKGIPGMPVTKTSSLAQYLDKTKEDFDKACVATKRTPKWVGELYLEFHRGTYTSIAKNKRNNRKSEFLLGQAEALSYTDLLFGGDYNAKGIYNNWNKVLHNQFHDIIPGSSIKTVYDGTDKDYAEVFDFTNGVIDNKLNKIKSNISSDGGIFVYNPSGFARRGMVTLNGKTVEIKEDIPAFGWSVANDFVQKSTVSVDGLTAENKFYKLELDQSGRIVNLFDKTANRRVFKEGEFGNELQVFEDYPKVYDNWEITDYYKEKMWILYDKAEITPVFDGSRAGFNVKRNYMNSSISQNIWLYSENGRIDFDTQIDWHQHHQILKVAFPLDVYVKNATYEIQYGHTSRPVHQNTSWDAAKFETCAHKWVDMSDSNYGVSLLNDCKYGYSALGNTLKLTILKCGTYPNAEADIGQHTFTYSLLSHQGSFREAGIINEAYALNQPMFASNVEKQIGTIKDNFSLVSTDSESVIIETVKKAENSDDMIVRMYEAFDSRTTAKITVTDKFKEAYLCDLMENEIEKLDFDGKCVTLPVKNFEIITLKFKK
ncbi:MAG: alpha-mannosidase [Ruminococcaceae bacterium]|nr:alpha-mannosidase [Oscillospiraceae bacterium]